MKDCPHDYHYALVYQCGIANVFQVWNDGPRRRLRQSDFRSCEHYAHGLRDGLNATSTREGLSLSVHHCDKAGDIAPAAWNAGAVERGAAGAEDAVNFPHCLLSRSPKLFVLNVVPL